MINDCNHFTLKIDYNLKGVEQLKKATFYHAGCPVCVDAEKMMLDHLDTSKVDLEIVHFGEESARISEAENAGVESVPALVLDGQVYHINYGASMEEVKSG